MLLSELETPEVTEEVFDETAVSVAGFESDESAEESSAGSVFEDESGSALEDISGMLMGSCEPSSSEGSCFFPLLQAETIRIRSAVNNNAIVFFIQRPP